MNIRCCHSRKGGEQRQCRRFGLLFNVHKTLYLYFICCLSEATVEFLVSMYQSNDSGLIRRFNMSLPALV